MENIKNAPVATATAAAPPNSYEKTKAYQDFINVLSQIIEKHGAEVLDEINRDV
ncbi:hypothetical protein SDC9_169851 [bioreactor metagenome]|uniref:Uncharacterized protein n=1 Tax=bioreactor metagenome TaxID=1076179 RepID=A0A645G6H1_9ZZZZ